MKRDAENYGGGRLGARVMTVLLGPRAKVHRARRGGIVRWGNCNGNSGRGWAFVAAEGPWRSAPICNERRLSRDVADGWGSDCLPRGAERCATALTEPIVILRERTPSLDVHKLARDRRIYCAGYGCRSPARLGCPVLGSARSLEVGADDVCRTVGSSPGGSCLAEIVRGESVLIDSLSVPRCPARLAPGGSCLSSGSRLAWTDLAPASHRRSFGRAGMRCRSAPERRALRMTRGRLDILEDLARSGKPDLSHRAWLPPSHGRSFGRAEDACDRPERAGRMTVAGWSILEDLAVLRKPACVHRAWLPPSPEILRARRGCVPIGSPKRASGGHRCRLEHHRMILPVQREPACVHRDCLRFAWKILWARRGCVPIRLPERALRMTPLRFQAPLEDEIPRWRPLRSARG